MVEADRKRSSIYSKSFDKFVKSMMELMAESLQNNHVTQASIFTIIYDYHKAIIRRDMVKDRVIGHFNKRTNKSVMKNMFKVVKPVPITAELENEDGQTQCHQTNQ